MQNLAKSICRKRLHAFEKQIRSLLNKKVFLRERKRHIAHHVASARYAALSPDGGGGVTRSRPEHGGYPIQSCVGWGGGVPPSSSGWGISLSTPGMGVPPLVQTWEGVPPCPDLGMGYPYPDLGME